MTGAAPRSNATRGMATTEMAVAERVRVGRPTRIGVSPETILDAARDAFAEVGYRRASLDTVATRVGVTRQALYHYFPSKHRILLTILVGYFDLLDEVLARAAEPFSDPAERFEAMLRRYFQVVAERPADAVVMTREFALLPKPEQRRIRERRRRVHDAFVREFAAAQADGSFRAGEPSVLVSLVLGAANWTPRWFRVRGSLTPVALGSFAQEFLAPAYRVATAPRRRGGVKP